jgi:hypothetical protein
MASPAPTKDNGLVAIAIVIRSKEGPRFVFHYPARPTNKVVKREKLFGTSMYETDSDEESETKDDFEGSDLEEDMQTSLRSLQKLGLSQEKKYHGEAIVGDDHYDTPSGEQVVPWEHLFEFSTVDLESILTPSRGFNKKRFEMNLDPLNFLSYPIHIREDGNWKKKKVKKPKKSKKEDLEGITTLSEGTSSVTDAKPVDTEEKKPSKAASEDGDDNGGMSMFNAVFILNVPKDEETQRLNEIYEHVVTDFNKALLFAQASSNYVWKESEMILAMKEKAREERELLTYCLLSNTNVS